MVAVIQFRILSHPISYLRSYKICETRIAMPLLSKHFTCMQE